MCACGGNINNWGCVCVCVYSKQSTRTWTTLYYMVEFQMSSSEMVYILGRTTIELKLNQKVITVHEDFVTFYVTYIPFILSKGVVGRYYWH